LLFPIPEANSKLKFNFLQQSSRYYYLINQLVDIRVSINKLFKWKIFVENYLINHIIKNEPLLVAFSGTTISSYWLLFIKK
tara:strand:- start:1553 stop:1795 length:243 start_codon:yes stop_codon:yes gene_type:complete